MLIVLLIFAFSLFITLWYWQALRLRRARRALESSQQLTRTLEEKLDSQNQQTQNLLTQLRSSEELNKFALQGSGDGIWNLNAETNEVTYCNRYRQLLGYTDEADFPNTSQIWRSLVHPDDIQAVNACIRRYYEAAPENTPTPHVIEYRMRHKNGSWRWMSSRGTVVLRNADGKPLRMTGTLTDITERKKTESEQIHTLLEASPDVMLLVYTSGIIAFANHATQTLFGYTINELIGSNVDQLLPTAMRTLHAQHRHQFTTRPDKYQMAPNRVLFGQRKDGSRVEIEVSLSSINIGDVMHIIVTLRDITERKQVENALRDSQERLNEIIEIMPVALFIKDHASRFLLMNRACEIQLGIPFAELQGTNGAHYFSHEQLQQYLVADQRTFEGRKMIDYEETIWNFKLEENRSIRTFKKPAYDHAGQPSHIICVSIDITDSRRAERALLELNEHLEERVSIRTHELDVAKKIAEEASMAKGKFLANMSHEIRTPMNGVIGMAYLALKTELKPKQRDYIEKIHSAGQHLLGLIDDILDFSKIEAGKLVIEDVDFVLDAVIKNLTDLVSDRIDSKGLNLVVDLAQDVPKNLRGDPLRLGQILINFTNNAIKFSNHGNIIIRAMNLGSTQSNCRLHFEVEDKGIGIGAEDISKLFQSFQQADTTTTRQYGGTGLGLVICKQLVELMHGQIGVRSQLGKGSTFWFEVTLGLSDKSEETKNPVNIPILSLHNIRILLAEDNLFNQQIAIELLEETGAVVCLANNGMEALDLLQKTSFDCVLMDVQMPVLNGLETTRQIRQNPLFAQLPIIAMTANASDKDRQQCIDSGMNDFVSKPIQPQLLYDTINQHLTKKHLSPPHNHASVPLAQTAPKIIDLNVLSNLLSGNADKVRQFSQKFIQSTQQSLEELDKALLASQIITINQLGHRMKSSARSVGAYRFSDLCEILESLTKDEHLRQAGDISRQLWQIFEKIRTIIETY